MSALRPLPATPNLEFARKEAKTLLRLLRTGDPESIERARAHHATGGGAAPRLADAQLVIAREYGFTSWPKLVRYFEDAERVAWNPRRPKRPAFYESMVRALAAEHRDRRTWTARALAAYIPRYYGKDLEDVFGDPPSADEARLAVARSYGFPSWQTLLERATDGAQDSDPRSGASVTADSLTVRLCGRTHMTADEVRHLLEQGADPNAVLPNGLPVLEHALLRYWNGQAVDVLAAHTRPRRALWIAAGLGDLTGVARSLDDKGRPTSSARRLRPDFVAVGPSPLAALPDASDEEILVEAFAVAMLNGRVAVMEYMASRGFPVNSMIWGSPLVNMAVGNAMVSVVESLVRTGADLDLRGWRPHQTAREIAREMLVSLPGEPARHRIAELCGCDPTVVLGGPGR